MKTIPLKVSPCGTKGKPVNPHEKMDGAYTIGQSLAYSIFDKAHPERDISIPQEPGSIVQVVDETVWQAFVGQRWRIIEPSEVEYFKGNQHKTRIAYQPVVNTKSDEGEVEFAPEGKIYVNGIEVPADFVDPFPENGINFMEEENISNPPQSENHHVKSDEGVETVEQAAERLYPDPDWNNVDNGISIMPALREAYIKGRLEQLTATASQEVDNWISVDERLPEVHQQVVFVLREGYVLPATAEYYINCKGFWAYDNRVYPNNGIIKGSQYKDVTHWQPLPSAPKGK